MSDHQLNYKLYFDENPAPSIVFDRETLSIIDVNKEAIAHYGYSREEFLCMTIKELRPLEEIPALMRGLSLTPSQIREIPFFRHKKKDGSLMDVLVSARDFEAGGRPCRFVSFIDITLRRQAEQAVLKSSEMYRKLILAIPDIVIRTDVSGNISFINEDSPLYKKYFTPDTDPRGSNFFSFIAPHDQQRALENYWKMLEKPLGIQEYDIILTDGRIISCDINGAVVFDDQNQPAELVFIVRDTTEKKKTEEALGKSEKKFRMMADLLPQTIFETDLEGWLLYVNKSAFEHFGYTSEEFEQGLNVFSMIAPEDRALAAQNIRELMAGGPIRGNEYRAVKKDRSVFPIMIYSTLVEEDGKPTGLRGILIDLTDIRKAEEEKGINESKFRAIYDQAAHLAGIVSKDGILLETNRMAREFIGADKSSFIGRLFWDTPWWEHSEESRQMLKSAFEKALTGEFVRFETTHLNHKKELRHIDFSFKPVLDKDGKVYCLIPEGRDITEQKQADRILHLVEYGVKHSRDSIFWLDSSTKLIYVNEAACRSLGYTREELLTMTISDVDPDFPPEAWPPQLERLRKCGSITHESRHRTKDGRIFPVEVTGNYVCFEGKEGSFAFARDITDRKKADEEREKLQAQLNQAQKMESIGRLAGGVAHDFNNMLGAIIGYVELGLIHAGDHPDIKGYLKQIQAAALRSADLTRQLLAFARKQTISPKVLELNKTIEGMLKMIQRLIGEDIELDWNPAQDLYPVRLDPSQVDQLLMNLCVNARDAIKGQGRVSIRTQNQTLTEADQKKISGSRPGHFVMVEVSDSGRGMDEKTLAHLFEPFFTTKEIGKGTGLGLATVYGIVQQNKGFIHVESQVSSGSTFRVYLPRHDLLPSQVEHVREEKRIEKGHETILLVEDEPVLLEMTKEMLELHGYKVLAADTPQQAENMAESSSSPIHLLMTDVVMPGMNGRDLAGRIMARISNLKCLFMSGYTTRIITRQGVLDEGLNFIQKPFSMTDLIVKVRQVLDMDKDSVKPE